MTASAPAPKPRTLSARRLVLLASVAGLGVAVLLGGAGLVPKASGPALSTVAYAQGVQRPMGFADIVDKVKPAVISVRVKVAAGPKMMGFEGDLEYVALYAGHSCNLVNDVKPAAAIVREVAREAEQTLGQLGR